MYFAVLQYIFAMYFAFNWKQACKPDYCCEVWDTINLTLSDRLQKLQNRAARIIMGRKNEHGQSELALAELQWKPLKERRTQFVASQMYKITHDLAPMQTTI